MFSRVVADTFVIWFSVTIARIFLTACSFMRLVPFSQHIAFIEKAKEVVTEKFCFLLPTTYLTGKERYAKVYADKSYGLSKIYIFVKSPNLTHEFSNEENAFYGGLTRVGWFVFEKGYSGPAMLDWIDNTHA